MKSFIKINRVKVIGTIILAIVNISLALYSSIAIVCTTNCPVPNFWQSFFSFTISPFVVIHFITEFFEGLRFLPDMLTAILSILSPALYSHDYFGTE
jgi:ABC-type transport system involved in cytochrome c biogenesis permease subunit